MDSLARAVEMYVGELLVHRRARLDRCDTGDARGRVLRGRAGEVGASLTLVLAADA